jgi:hypothetical protein
MTPFRPFAGAMTTPALGALTTVAQPVQLQQSSDQQHLMAERRVRRKPVAAVRNQQDPVAVVRTVLGRMKPEMAAASESEFLAFAGWIGLPDAQTAALQLIGVPELTLGALMSGYEQYLLTRSVFSEERGQRIERLRSMLSRVRAACPRSRVEILDVAHLHTLWMRLSTASGQPAVRCHTQAVVALLISPQLTLDQIAAVTLADCHTEGFISIRTPGTTATSVVGVSTVTSAALDAWRRHLQPGGDGPLFLGRQRGQRAPLRRVQALAQLVRGLTPLLGRPVDAQRILAAARVEVRLHGMQPCQLVMPNPGLSA